MQFLERIKSGNLPEEWGFPMMKSLNYKILLFLAVFKVYTLIFNLLDIRNFQSIKFLIFLF